MTIVKDILKHMLAVKQPQRKFLETLFVTILALRGRVNFRNLSRYCDYSERTLARQFRSAFDWPDFHQRVIKQALKADSVMISAQDASFIPQSGKQSFGLGYFFNGCHARPRTRAGNLHARAGGCDAPWRLHASGGANAPRA